MVKEMEVEKVNEILFRVRQRKTEEDRGMDEMGYQEVSGSLFIPTHRTDRHEMMQVVLLCCYVVMLL